MFDQDTVIALCSNPAWSPGQEQDLAGCGAVHTNKNQPLPWRIYKLNRWAAGR